MNIKTVGVLMLNRSYVAIKIVNWKNAISLVFQGHAYALDRSYCRFDYNQWLEFSKQEGTKLDNYEFIKTSQFEIAVPTIIILSDYGSVPACEVNYSRQTVFERDGFRCSYCGKQFHRNELNIDHVIPRKLGGDSSWENTVTSCYKCNSKKADKPLDKCGMKLLITPKKPKWISPFKRIAELNDIDPSWEPFLNIAVQ